MTTIVEIIRLKWKEKDYKAIVELVRKAEESGMVTAELLVWKASPYSNVTGH